MSTFLILLLALLLGGAIVSFLLARYRPRFAADAAATAAVLALIAWLFAERSLPFDGSTDNTGLTAEFSVLKFGVDDFVWRTSFSLLLLVVASILVMISFNRLRGAGRSQSIRNSIVPGVTLLTTTATLFSLWAITLPALLTGWTLLAGAWAILLWASWKDRDDPAASISKMGLLLFSLLFLGFALAAQPNHLNLASTPDDWSSQARVWAMMAAVVLLGAFPFHWWRSSAKGLVGGSEALIYLAPSIAGAHLLARLAASSGGEDGVYIFILTAFGLLGILYSVGYSWSNLDNPKSVVASLVLGLAAMILMAAAWAGKASVHSLTQVLILAAGGMLLAVSWPGQLKPVYKIPLLVGAAAIAGFPLTAGFQGLTSLYGNLEDQGRLLLAIVTAMTYTPIIAAAFLHFRWLGGDSRQVQASTLGIARFVFALSILALGLITFPVVSAENTQVISWILILISLLGALGIAWYVARALDVQQALKGAFQFRIPTTTGKRIARSILLTVGTVIREAAVILEGEGGMLWVLLLVVIFWLTGLT